MRFIFNFFFFGILFYLIWMFFPDAFLTLISWADHIVAFFKDLFLGLWGKYHNEIPHSPTGPAVPTSPAHAMVWLFLR
jgi:hypothetical protein